MSPEPDHTSLALLEQLVYIDLYLQPGFENETPSSLELDEQLSMDLAMFADDAFVFPDEKKGSVSHGGGNGDHNGNANGAMNKSPIVGSSSDALSKLGNRLEAKPIADNNNTFALSLGNSDSLITRNTILTAGSILSRDRDSTLSYQSHHVRATLSNSPADQDGPNNASLFTNYEANTTPTTFLSSESFQNTQSRLDIESPYNSESIFSRNNNKPSPVLRQLSSSHNSPIPLGHYHLPIPGPSHLTNLPRFPVPPGAEVSLRSVGLLQNQIDLLSALIAQHQANIETSVRGAHAPPKETLSHSLSPPSSLSHGTTGEQRPPIRSYPMASRVESLALPGSPMMRSFSDTNQASSSSSPTNGESGGHQDLSDLDKRRRNTAALARFRVKKKLKEKSMDSKLQTMEQTIREFEDKIQRLEMENKLLRTLIVERGSKKSDEELEDLRRRAAKR